MAAQSPKSFFSTAEDVVNADLPRRGRVLLILLKSYEGLGTVYQHNGGVNRGYFFAMIERRNVGLGPLPSQEPDYGADQPKVSMAFREAWSWLEKESCLTRTPDQPHPDWYSITPTGEKLWAKAIRFEHWEKEGLESVRHKLYHDPLGGIGGTPEIRAWAAEWVRMKDGNNEVVLTPETQPPASSPAPLYGLHADINEKCISLFKSGHYAEAVEKGFKVVRDRLRALTSHEKGADAFGKGKLRVNGASAPHVENDFNEAAKFLLMAIDFFRNEKAHTSDAKITDPTRAEHYLMLSSLAMYLLDGAQAPATPSADIHT